VTFRIDVLLADHSILSFELTFERRRHGYCGGRAEEDLVFGDKG
jgi:hypothetical protein